ncbi:glutathione reductase, mitochondrial-like [Sycon ciliatum]|uniref:glutathione reductase, mitochondrial-like n=1 Tax=Sycon ciliatum TaxID=27933 RepID=UPI0020ACFA9C|eukprot:scpid62975/ scgid22796/ Glutathione reductase, mitochondrial
MASVAKYDLLVLGAGSGGLGMGRRAARLGQKVALFEGSPVLGGTCVNVGCVPKKVMFNAAKHAEFLHDHAGYGFTVGEHSFSWNTLKTKRDAYIKRLNGIYETNVVKDKVDTFMAKAQFVSGHSEPTVEADGKLYTAPHICIATGGRPMVPDIPGAEHGITSDGFFELETQPKKVAVVGAGYIAVELAGIFGALGSEVDLFIRKEKVLRVFDDMLSEALMTELPRGGVAVHPHTQLQSVTKEADGTLTIKRISDGKEVSGSGYDCLLWAIGRVPNIEIGLDHVGVELERGHIKVDEFQNTSAKGVYAIGDVQGKALLTPVAIAAGRRLAHRLFDNQPTLKLDYNNIATVIFSHPTIGTVGPSEAEAIKEHGADKIKSYTTRSVNMYHALKDPKDKIPTIAKMITLLPEERILGLHIIGDGADEMIQGFAVAIKMGATHKDFNDTIAIHPTGSEEIVLM